MAYFSDADEVYGTLGKLFAQIAVDPELAPKFRRANTIVRYQYSNPDSAITVRLQEGGDGDVDFGESEMEPEVTMAMEADTAHLFWLGHVNVTVALARGQIKATGPVARSSSWCHSRSPSSLATRRSSRNRAAPTCSMSDASPFGWSRRG